MNAKLCDSAQRKVVSFALLTSAVVVYDALAEIRHQIIVAQDVLDNAVIVSKCLYLTLFGRIDIKILVP